jgi:S1-C subfamily serine protease
MRDWNKSARLIAWLLPLLVLLAGCASFKSSAPSPEVLERKILALEKRLDRLESMQSRRSDALTKVRDSVVFIWGAYTFIDSQGRPLRHVLNEKGRPVADPQGVPLADIKGTGTIVYTNYCGTGFLAGAGGLVLTNRHLAQPWWNEKKDESLIRAGLKPVFLILRAFFPDQGRGVPIEVVSYDEHYDIAMVRMDGVQPDVEPMELYPETENIREGQAIFLLGYPTGLDAVLAKLDVSAYVDEGEGACSYSTAERLSAGGLLTPTATSGFLWEAYPHVLVYDARTVGGGSGGPILDMNGRVLGVNAAYLEEFQGGNYGIPVAIGHALLENRGIPTKESRRESPEMQRLACGEDRFSIEAGRICSKAQRRTGN